MHTYRLLYSSCVLTPPWPSVTPWGRPQSTWEAREGTKESRTSKQEVPCLPLVPQQSTCGKSAGQAPGLRSGPDLTQACASAARTVSGSFQVQSMAALSTLPPSPTLSHPPTRRTRGDTGQWHSGTGAPHSSATPASLWFKGTCKQTLRYFLGARLWNGGDFSPFPKGPLFPSSPGWVSASGGCIS